jgi:hypothetical protein
MCSFQFQTRLIEQDSVVAYPKVKLKNGGDKVSFSLSSFLLLLALSIFRFFSLPNHYRTMIVLVIALMMEAVQTSETRVNPYQSTRRYNPEDSHLHSHRRENLKSKIRVVIYSQSKPNILRTRKVACVSYAFKLFPHIIKLPCVS